MSLSAPFITLTLCLFVAQRWQESEAAGHDRLHAPAAALCAVQQWLAIRLHPDHCFVFSSCRDGRETGPSAVTGFTDLQQLQTHPNSPTLTRNKDRKLLSKLPYVQGWQRGRATGHDGLLRPAAALRAVQLWSQGARAGSALCDEQGPRHGLRPGRNCIPQPLDR